MPESWKTILCDSEQCISQMFKSEGAGLPITKISKETLEKYKVYPDIDNDVMTQFTCPKCGKVVTWGVTRRKIAKTLYERFNK